ncbi:MAG: glycosyltransferase family 39 protein [Tepidisphaeraceae bacterium]|jgi:4-amino-4-deoxy-L-arabinose transferase-like glycosyltransferase
MSRASVIILLLFGATLLFAGLGQRTLTQHEVFAAQPAKEMVRYGHWIVPMFAGIPRTAKPPMTGWLIAGVMKLTGSEAEWAARFPAAAAGLVSAALIAWVAGRAKGGLVGLVTGLVQLTSVFTLMQARLAEADMIVCAAVSGAMTCLVFGTLEGWRGDKPCRWLSLTFYACAGLAFLLKGVPLAFIGLAAVAWALVRHDRFIVRFLLDPIGLTLLLFCIVAWPVAAYRSYPAILDSWKFELFGTASGALGRDPLYTYLLTIPAVLMPWFPLALFSLLVAMVKVWHQPHPIPVALALQSPVASGVLNYQTPRQPPPNLWARALGATFRHMLVGHPFRQFLLCWFLPGVIFLHFSAFKHKHYPIPMLPPLSLVAAVGLVQYIRWQHQKTKPQHTMAALLWFAGLAVAGVAIWRIPPAKPAQLEITAVLIVVWIGGTLAIYFEHEKHLIGQLAAIFATAWLVGITVAAIIIPRHFDDYRFSRDFAAAANTKIPPGVMLCIIDPELRVEPHVVYYLRPPVQRYPTAGQFLDYVASGHAPRLLYVVAREDERNTLAALGTLSPIVAAKPPPGRPRPEQRMVLYQLLTNNDVFSSPTTR